MITYLVEPWSLIRSEIAQLWQRHYDELVSDKDKIPLAPDYRQYQEHATSGALHIVTARSDGQLIGYVFAIVRPHLHYATTLCGFWDLYYVTPEHRKGLGLSLVGHPGVALFREAEKSLRARGVKKMFSGTKMWRDASHIFEYLGWVETERLFTKWIGD